MQRPVNTFLQPRINNTQQRTFCAIARQSSAVYTRTFCNEAKQRVTETNGSRRDSVQKDLRETPNEDRYRATTCRGRGN